MIETALFQGCKAAGITMQLQLLYYVMFVGNGATVMISKRCGVSTHLRAQKTLVINIPCVTCCCLAAAEASESISYLKKFQNTIHNLYFYHNSSVHVSGLHAVQGVLGDPGRNLKEGKEVWWLLHNKAVT